MAIAMIDNRLWWYLARSSGIVALALIVAVVALGLVHAARVRGRWGPPPPWSLDLHRGLGGGAAAFTGLHLFSLWADSYVHIAWREILVPFGSSWRPGAVAWGVASLYLLALVEGSSLFQRQLHIPKRVWRALHMASFPLLGLAALHGVLAGTDMARASSIAAVVAALAATVALGVRRLQPVKKRAAKGKPKPGGPVQTTASTLAK